MTKAQEITDEMVELLLTEGHSAHEIADEMVELLLTEGYSVHDLARHYRKLGISAACRQTALLILAQRLWLSYDELVAHFEREAEAE